jgi:hypothetical protein
MCQINIAGRPLEDRLFIFFVRPAPHSSFVVYTLLLFETATYRSRVFEDHKTKSFVVLSRRSRGQFYLVDRAEPAEERSQRFAGVVQGEVFDEEFPPFELIVVTADAFCSFPHFDPHLRSIDLVGGLLEERLVPGGMAEYEMAVVPFSQPESVAEDLDPDDLSEPSDVLADSPDLRVTRQPADEDDVVLQDRVRPGKAF